jgi:hypothetical protein
MLVSNWVCMWLYFVNNFLMSIWSCLHPSIFSCLLHLREIRFQSYLTPSAFRLPYVQPPRSTTDYRFNWQSHYVVPGFRLKSCGEQDQVVSHAAGGLPRPVALVHVRRRAPLRSIATRRTRYPASSLVLACHYTSIDRRRTIHHSSFFHSKRPQSSLDDRINSAMSWNWVQWQRMCV